MTVYVVFELPKRNHPNRCMGPYTEAEMALSGEHHQPSPTDRLEVGAVTVEKESVDIAYWVPHNTQGGGGYWVTIDDGRQYDIMTIQSEPQ